MTNVVSVSATLVLKSSSLRSKTSLANENANSVTNTNTDLNNIFFSVFYGFNLHKLRSLLIFFLTNFLYKKNNQTKTNEDSFGSKNELKVND